jgi:hypothetical protein
MTRPNLSLGGFDLSSCYYLKLSKIDISENLRFLAPSVGGLKQRPEDPKTSRED